MGRLVDFLFAWDVDFVACHHAMLLRDRYVASLAPGKTTPSRLSCSFCILLSLFVFV